MKERKYVVRFFGMWNDEKEEQWLQQMAQSGWHLVRARLLYVFEKGEPANELYRIDYRYGRRESREAPPEGWTQISSCFGWRYLRSLRADSPDVYPTTSARLDKHLRLLRSYALLCFGTIFSGMHGLLEITGRAQSTAGLLLGRSLVIGYAALWLYIITRAALHVRALRQQAAHEAASL